MEADFRPPVRTVLNRRGLASIDGIDLSIHPLVLPEIVRWFHDPGRNPHNAQFWMTCHNPALMGSLTKEEIYFCEKNSRGETDVFGLREVRGVRRLEDYERKYLGGVYGAVPVVG